MVRGAARGRGRGSIVRRVLLHGEGSSREGGRSFSEVPHEDSVDVSFNASQYHAEGSQLDVVNEPTDNTGQLSRELTSVDVPRPSKRKRKGRGPAIGIDKPKLLSLRPVIKFENGCPVHATRDDFNTKLGIWARDQHRFPYETSNFDDFQGDVWKTLLEDVNAYFNIDYDGNLLELVMGICRRRWNEERSKMYRLNYACYDTHEEALLHPPKYVEPETWRRVCENVFRDPEWKKRSDRNSINRSQQVIIHKSGRKSFTQSKVEMREEIQREPYRFELFQKCYKGKKGYANSPTRIATEKLVELAQDNPENEDQAFLEVFGPEHKGRKRGTGRGITSCQNSEPSLRSQVEKLTQLQAERDIKDAERDKKDAEREKNDAEMRNQMNEIKAQLDILLKQRTPIFSHVPHQHQMTDNQQYQVPNQIQIQTPNLQHQTQISYPQQQIQFPVYQPQVQFRHQKETFQQQLQGFTDLLRNGDDPRFGLLANPANEPQP